MQIVHSFQKTFLLSSKLEALKKVIPDYSWLLVKCNCKPTHLLLKIISFFSCRFSFAVSFFQDLTRIWKFWPQKPSYFSNSYFHFEMFFVEVVSFPLHVGIEPVYPIFGKLRWQSGTAVFQGLKTRTVYVFNLECTPESERALSCCCSSSWPSCSC